MVHIPGFIPLLTPTLYINQGGINATFEVPVYSQSDEGGISESIVANLWKVHNLPKVNYPAVQNTSTSNVT